MKHELYIRRGKVKVLKSAMHNGLPDHRLLQSVDGLPGIIWDDGTQFWYSNGRLHRTDGPSVIGKNASWFLNGKQIYSAEVFQKLTGNSDEQMAEIIMKFGAI